MATPDNNTTPFFTISQEQYSNQNNIDSLLGETKWGNGPLGTEVQGLEYSFMQSPPLLQDGYNPGGAVPEGTTIEQFLQNFSPLTNEQVIAADTAMNAWAEVANITFNRIDNETAELVGDIRFGRSIQVNDGRTASAFYPSNHPTAGDIWFSSQDNDGKAAFNINVDNGSITSKGTYAYATFLHEIGHALGLKHPHEDGVIANLNIDTTAYSVMSYRSYVGQPVDDGYQQNFYPTTPMINDIAAIQYLYGKNMNTRNGNTIYSWKPNEQIFETIWDAGGTDTIDWSNQNSDAKIDLSVNKLGEEVKWSELGQGYNNGIATENKNLAIAYDIEIENANGGSGNDTIIGNQFANQLKGNQGHDSLEGGAGNDTLDGGLDNDSMSGGQGDDSYYVDNPFDTITEWNFQGNDIVYSSSGDYTLSNNLEKLNLLEGSGAINGTGNQLNNIITGNSSDNSLNGLGGNDTLIGAGGNDSYYVDVIGDKIIELSGEGNDTVYSLITYTLGENLENLTLNGNAEIDGIGNNLDNIITGNSSDNYLKGGDGNDELDGGLGNDSMSGQLGDDIYYVDSINDTVIELTNQGKDTVYSSITYKLGENLENLALNGNTEINGTGNNLENIIIGNNNNNYLEGLTGNDTLIGGNGNDTLDGGFDNDSMSGELGDDSYYVDSVNDTITELNNEGNDTVYSAITYTLGENLENLTLIGNDAINGTGNSLNNIITGNSVNNSLKGKQGNDKLIGGKGADILDGGEGNDTASYSTATNGLTANLTNSQENTGDAQGDIFQSIENLEGSEFGDRLFGDVQNNDIRGLGGDDFLDGLTGDDTMSGGTGNDTYKVENVNDVVIENANQGIDTVDAAIDYVLSENVENLNLLEGTAALNGTGNELNNIINGNTGNNTLNGEAGNDTLFGFSGSDVISGGDGDDSIIGGLGNESFVPGSLGKINGVPGSDILTGGNGNDAFIYNNIADTGDLITDFTVGDDKIVITELLQSLGYGGSDPINDGFLGFKQASDSLAVLQIDPDGASSDLFGAVPFVLLNNVSAAALNDSSNFVF